MTVFVANTNLLELLGLQNAITSAYINDATVTCTLYDNNGVQVTGQGWPTTLAYVASSNGNYRCALASAIAFSAGKTYVAKIEVTAGSNTGHWEFSFVPETRVS